MPSLFKKIFTFKNKRNMPIWLAWPLATLGKIFFFTCRTRIHYANEQQKTNVNSPHIFACWHNRIICGVPMLPKKMRSKVSLLISASRDGEYIATLASCFSLKSVRGSSSRGGTAALLALKKELESGQSLFITIDGPRGPRYSVQAGAIALAALTGCKIVPISFNFSRYIQMKSWDKMQFPYPFSKVDIVLGEELSFNDVKNIEKSKEKLREELLKITVDKK